MPNPVIVDLSHIEGVSLSKKSDDPSGVCRVSIGGLGGNIPAGVYCVYRGTKEQAIAALTATIKVLSSLDKEPDIEPDTPGKWPS
jgi:hypothetical protein